MFGKKPLVIVSGLQEEAEEWDGYENQVKSGRPTQQGAEKISVSAENTAKVRTRFYDLVNPAIAVNMSKEELIDKITQAVSEIVNQEKIPLNWKEQSLIAQDLLNDMTGLGPIESLLLDESITDILVNGYDSVFIERNGTLEHTGLKFRDDQHVLDVARRMAASVGRRVDESSAMVDARLADGSRVNIITPPLSVHGTVISIRKFPTSQTTLSGLVEKGSMTKQMAAFLEIAARIRLNILICGGTGSGKTTLLNALSGKIGNTERVVTIEDAAEINLLQSHVISLETRQKNIEGGGEVSQRDLLRNALRMRPDRIVVGEVRGAEAHEMLQAMNTGHDGSMSTIHANSARDSLMRIEDLLLTYQGNFHPTAVRWQIASALDLIIHMARDIHGHRYIKSITEVLRVEGDVIVTQDLFVAEEPKDPDADLTSRTYIQLNIRPHSEKKAKRYKLDKQLDEIMRW